MKMKSMGGIKPPSKPAMPAMPAAPMRKSKGLTPMAPKSSMPFKKGGKAKCK